MRRRMISRMASCLLLLAFGAAPAFAQEGQEDLDKATELKLTANSVADLEKVVELGESDLKKGLDDDNQDFEKQLVSSSLLEAASEL